jgi:uncharacterized membrane protein
VRASGRAVANTGLSINTVRSLAVLLVAIGLMLAGALAGVWITSTSHSVTASASAVQAQVFPQGPDRNAAPQAAPSDRLESRGPR